MATMTLSEFLQKNADQYEAEAAKNREVVREWQEALPRLFATIRGWIAESDPKGFIEVSESKTDVREPSLGWYKVPRLDIRAFSKWIGILPKVRMSVGTVRPPDATEPIWATGRVDITNEIRRFVLYRVHDGGRDSWFIQDPTSNATKPLTKESFEEALLSYFL